MLQKLKHKSLPEISFRVKKLIQKKVEAATFNPKSIAKELDSLPVYNSKQEFLEREGRPNFFFYPSRKEVKTLFLNHFQKELEQTLKRADNFLENKFHFLGGEIQFNGKIDWQIDPITGKEYPRCFYQDIDIFSNDEEKDIKYVCEVNRQQYLIELSKAYFLTGDKKYAQKVVDTITAWDADNPYKLGVTWTCGLEVAVRFYSWLWSFYFLLDSDLLNSDIINLFVRQMYLHGKYLSEHQSFYSSPYNHLIGETSALYMIGYLFPEFPKSKKWRETAWKTLVSEMPKQFHKDGMSVEQASFYHYFTLGFYLMPIILRLQNKDTVPEPVMSHLQNIMEFGMQFTRPDGTTPGIGDIDNARSIYFTDPEHWDFRNFLAIGAVLFHSENMKGVAKQEWEDILWLFGVDGWNTFQQLEAKEPQNLHQYFPESGYFLIRNGWAKDSHFFWIDCGEISDGVFKDEVSSAAHGHADILSFELTAHGKNFIIDPGFHNYKGNFEWHKYFRETKAHNCLLIDSLSQAVHGKGLMEWSQVAEPRDIKFITDRDYVFFRASHDGYDHLPGSPRHYRNVLFVNNEIWILIDQVSGTGDHLIESYLHFSPVEVEKDSYLWSFKKDDVQLKAFFWGAPMNDEVLEGGKDIQEGWISPLYRNPIPAPLIRFHERVKLPFIRYSAFIPELGEAVKIDKQDENHYQIKLANNSYSISTNEVKEKDNSEGFILRVEWLKQGNIKRLDFVESESTYRLSVQTLTKEGEILTSKEEKIG